MGRRSALPQSTVNRIKEARVDALSMAKIADTLNQNGVATAAGGRWYASTIKQILDSRNGGRALSGDTRNGSLRITPVPA
ncbi:recombinase family protein [Arthrobacter antioxidans]|uniref:recombinase family protein n=1 Tax=Arthrobacter antioxidans TaxID=2895818 RepID=UPI003AF1AB8E